MIKPINFRIMTTRICSSKNFSNHLHQCKKKIWIIHITPKAITQVSWHDNMIVQVFLLRLKIFIQHYSLLSLYYIEWILGRYNWSINYEMHGLQKAPKFLFRYFYFLHYNCIEIKAHIKYQIKQLVILITFLFLQA